jgi:hypothetical protein
MAAAVTESGQRGMSVADGEVSWKVEMMALGSARVVRV